MIKAVTFDLDGVYFTPQSFKNFKTNLPKAVTDEDKVNWVLYKSEEMRSFKLGKISEDVYWNFVRRELGSSLDNQDIFKLLQESYTINPEVQSYVREVRAKGIKTCICSNNFVTRIRELDAKFDFQKDFDIRVYSYEVGAMKPDKAICTALINQTGVKPEEIIYADDDESKLQGAIDLGINAFVYTDFATYQRKVNTLTRSPGVQLDDR
jgi:epoxide hydrolase-like predicted phosphatase